MFFEWLYKFLRVKKLNSLPKWFRKRFTSQLEAENQNKKSEKFVVFFTASAKIVLSCLHDKRSSSFLWANLFQMLFVFSCYMVKYSMVVQFFYDWIMVLWHSKLYIFKILFQIYISNEVYLFFIIIQEIFTTLCTSLWSVWSDTHIIEAVFGSSIRIENVTYTIGVNHFITVSFAVLGG